MARNPLAKVTDAAQGAASLPLKATEKLAGVAADGVRVAASLVYSAAERAKSLAGIEEDQQGPAPTDAPLPPAPQEPVESVETLAEAAVARELAEEPLPTLSPSKAARAVATTRTAEEPDKVVFTSESSPAPANESQFDGEPLIDPATAKALKSETDILRAAADVDRDL